MTKIDVISGFLGAGKTTFIRKLIGEALVGEKIVLIENEFGEISIDGGFLKDSGIEIREMSQGCICCSLVGDFEKSLREVIERFDADRIIIEPSGVGKLSDVMKAVTKASASLDVELNSSVTLVDAKKYKLYAHNFGEFFLNQIEYAGTVVLSRTDILDEAAVLEAAGYIAGINPKAEVVTTPIARLSGERLLAIIEKHDDTLDEMRLLALNEPDGEDEEEHHHHHHHHDHEDEGDDHDEHHHDEDDEEHGHHHDEDDEEHGHHHDEDGHHHHDHDDEHGHHHHDHDADEIFQSYGWAGVPAITYERLNGILKNLSEDPGAVLRAKGIVEAADKDSWYYFDMVPGEYEIREGAADYTGRVTVIGSDLDRSGLKELFFT